MKTIDVTGLPDQTIADIESHVRGAREAPDGTYEYKLGSGWRCFHCGETFYTPAGAALHFGQKVTGRPICVQSTADMAALQEIIIEIAACFDAAYAEGLQELLADLPNTNDRVDALLDLINRRILYAHGLAKAAGFTEIEKLRGDHSLRSKT